MRKAVIGLALATTVLATPSFARDGQMYGGIEAGVVLSQSLDTDFDLDGDNEFDEDELDILRFDTKTGWGGDLVVGYDFGMFRLEAEGG